MSNVFFLAALLIMFEVPALLSAPPSVEAIHAVWSSREQQFNSFHFHMEENHFIPAGGTSRKIRNDDQYLKQVGSIASKIRGKVKSPGDLNMPKTDSHSIYHYDIQITPTSAHAIYDRRILNRATHEYTTEKFESTTRDQFTHSLSSPKEGSSQPLGRVSPDRKTSDLMFWQLKSIFLHLRGATPWLCQADILKYQPTGVRKHMGAVEVHEYSEPMNSLGRNILWIAMDSDYSVYGTECEYTNWFRSFVKIQYGPLGGLALPIEWDFVIYGADDQIQASSIFKLTELSVNEEAPASDPKLPPGTKVIDEVNPTTQVGIVQSDGSIINMQTVRNRQIQQYVLCGFGAALLLLIVVYWRALNRRRTERTV